jgi:hypothetical protein
MHASDSLDLPRALDAIGKDGFVILEHQISPGTVARIRDELSPYLQKQHMGRNDFEGFHSERVYALLAKAPSIATLVEHASVLALADAILPKNYLLSSALAINVHPGETAQSFHIDDAPGGGPDIPRPRAPFGVSSIWALDDFTDTNGATEVIPGSHRWPAATASGCRDCSATASTTPVSWAT